MEVRIRKGTAGDLDAFADLLEEVHKGMEHPEWFYVDSREEFYQWMAEGAMHLWLAETDGRLAGAFDILLPGPASYNYGHALGYSREQLMQVVNMDSAAVHPDYRGLGIQKKLLQAAEDWLGREEERILLCTVHPDNRFSLHNALAQGYRIEKEISIYGSVRYLLQKNISKIEK